MKAICPYCEREFVKGRRNQVFCRQSCRQGQYMQRKQGFAGALSSQTASNPSAANNDGLMTDNDTTYKTSINRIESVREHGEKRESVNNPSQVGHSVPNMEIAFKTGQEDPLPVESIPKQLPGEGIFAYMVKHQLILPVLPEDFTPALFPHWTAKDKKAFYIANDKMVESFNLLLGAHKRKIKPSFLNKVYNSLHELTGGIYSLFIPDDYPFTRFIGLIKHKLITLIEKTGTLHEIDFVLPEVLTNQIMMICLYAKRKI